MANGLINLQTDLTSLKYSSMPLGSDKPLITKNIGQAPGSQIGTEISRRIDDTSRIAQMLISKPGIKYLLHEAQLQQIGVGDRIRKAQKGGKSLVGAVLGQLGNTAVNTLKIVGSTLAQVPVNGTGTHFLKGFKTDTYLQPKDSSGTNAFTRFFGAGGVEGAQYALRGETVPGQVKNSNFYTEGQDSLYTSPRKNTGQGILPSLNLSQTSNTYLPPASGGDIDNAILATQLGNEDALGNLTRTYEDVKAVKRQNDETPPTDTTDKFPKKGISGNSEVFDQANPTLSKYLVQKQSVQTLNGNITKEKRFRLGDQGASSTPDKQFAKKTNQYWFMSDDVAPKNSPEVDKINALSPSDGKIEAGDSTDYVQRVLLGGQTAGRDLIKFRFHILTADGKEKVLYFRAFLDSFTDNYSGTWNPVKYLGRAEDFQIYGGFQRKISLSFKIAAATRVEMRPLYEKMIWLASATAPTYATGGQFMRGTITKITVGDYIYEQPGVLNSVNYTWNTEYPWEVAVTQPEQLGIDDFEQELPMVLDCSIDFTPIHTFTPVTGLKSYITTKTTEGGNAGLTDIDNENTGIEPVPEISATQAAGPPLNVRVQSIEEVDAMFGMGPQLNVRDRQSIEEIDAMFDTAPPPAVMGPPLNVQNRQSLMSLEELDSMFDI